jgi:hypothetical protein
MENFATPVTGLNTSARIPSARCPVPTAYFHRRSSVLICRQFPLKCWIRHHNWLRFFTRPLSPGYTPQKMPLASPPAASPGTTASFFQLRPALQRHAQEIPSLRHPFTRPISPNTPLPKMPFASPPGASPGSMASFFQLRPLPSNATPKKSALCVTRPLASLARTQASQKCPLRHLQPPRPDQWLRFFNSAPALQRHAQEIRSLRHPFTRLPCPDTRLQKMPFASPPAASSGSMASFFHPTSLAPARRPIGVP